VIILLCTILFCLYAALEGHRESRHFYYRVSSTRQDNYNEHAIFAIQRFIAWIPFEYVMFDSSNILTALNGVFLGFMFILWHDGVYYWTYNKLSGIYPLGFWDQSKTSNSWMDKHDLCNPVMRITYFVIGVVGLILINYAKY
jgi:hypothetical protein